MAFDDTKDEHFKGKKSGRIYLTTHRASLLAVVSLSILYFLLQPI